MNKNTIGMIVIILLVIGVIWLVSGGSVKCHDSFWNKDKTVIEIKHS